jgi:uncharacterized protein (TIGR03083 family)
VVTDARAEFADAAAFLLDVLRRVPADRWDAPGLGVWSVRELAGHASRGLSTVIEYLEAPAPAEAAIPDGATYFATFADAGPELAAAVAERGRQAGAALGPDPVASVQAVVDQAMSVLAAHPGDRVVMTRGGGMALDAYVPTRTFELIVHGLDLAAAAGIEAEPPADALRSVLHLIADVALRRGLGPDLCLAATGRKGWDGGRSVI